MNFAVKSELIEEGIAVIDLKGEVDLYTAPEFKQHLLGQIESGILRIIVDFTDTTFIDSTTLGVLVGGVKRLRPEGGQLLLVCSDRNIIKIFEITGLHRVFEIHDTRESALEAAREAAPAG
ncbi:MAG: STAS domain-containing protein [Gaiellales bacterium]